MTGKQYQDRYIWVKFDFIAAGFIPSYIGDMNRPLALQEVFDKVQDLCKWTSTLSRPNMAIKISHVRIVGDVIRVMLDETARPDQIEIIAENIEVEYET